MDFLLQIDNISYIILFLRIYFISIFTYYIALRIINKALKLKINIIVIIVMFIIGIMYLYIQELSNHFYSKIYLVLFLSIILTITTKIKIGNSIFIVTIAFGINCILYFLSVVIAFIPNVYFKITNNLLGLAIIILIYMVIIFMFITIKKLNKGIIHIEETLDNDLFDIFILNISITVIFLITIIGNHSKLKSDTVGLGLLIFSIIMFITIQKSLQLYYKQRLLEQELKETKEELENKKKEIEKLEAENLNFSKTSHTLAHKQKSLEYKLEQLKQKYEIAEEIEIKDRIKNLSKELYGKTIEMELSKTGILEIDDMLKYMQSECIKNKIEFQLQIKGNIYEMVNNYISKEDLSTLIADHVKNAIIAINYSDNINKSILVRLGKIDKIYSLYIYDSGIEFEQETLSNLGKKPSTTHADNGGTGMGFMNTFDTLRKYKASLIINEYSKPCKDNYTKSIMIKFDKKEEFKINSYRQR